MGAAHAKGESRTQDREFHSIPALIPEDSKNTQEVEVFGEGTVTDSQMTGLSLFDDALQFGTPKDTGIRTHGLVKFHQLRDSDIQRDVVIPFRDSGCLRQASFSEGYSDFCQGFITARRQTR